jgi:hypothetical protein
MVSLDETRFMRLSERLSYERGSLVAERMLAVVRSVRKRGTATHDGIMGQREVDFAELHVIWQAFTTANAGQAASHAKTWFTTRRRGGQLSGAINF